MTQLGPTEVFDLPATLDPSAARMLAEKLSKLSRSSEIRLNAAAVSEVSPGYLQVLVSAFKTFSNIGVSNPSAEFAAAFAEYGIEYPVAPAAAPPVADVAEVAMPEAIEEPPPVVVELPAPQIAEPKGEVVELAHADETPARPAPASKKILTIDDSRTMRDMLKMTLSGAGFTVIQAVDGQDGLNALAQQPVDLIITDINMPKLDGFGVIRAVRSDHAHDSTPILVLSTEGEQESKDIAKEAGATGWIVKPFDPDGLVKLVNTVCG
jgi:two-component system, chemotaxis family, chemotaxis protein CheY